jgi:4-amino-4-deoxy-L-arabinose transferase-like glycosyltransferase
LPANQAAQQKRQLPHSVAVGTYALLSIPLVFYNLGHYGLVNGDEAGYQYYARNMVETGNWFRFEFAGESRFYDAFTHGPLFVWLKAVVITIFGDNYWTMRSVSALFALLGVCATYALACRLIDRRAALLAGLLHLTTYQFIYLHGARTGEMEPMIACLMTLILLFFLRAVEDEERFIPHHVLVVALLWSKAALVLIPIAVELIYFALHPAQLRRFVPWLKHGAWIFALGGMWHVGQALFNWQEFEETLAVLSRQAGGNSESAGSLGRIQYYLPILFWGGFPHSLFYPVGAISFLGLGRNCVARRSWRLLGISLLITLGFYVAVSMRYPWYITPLYPLLCIAVASWFARLTSEARRPWIWVLTLSTLAVAPWIRIEGFLSLNPFEKSAFRVRGDVGWVGLGGLTAEACIAISLGLAIAIGLLTWNRLSRRLTCWAALAMVLGLLGVAGLRLEPPLHFTDHISRLEQFVLRLDARRERGETIGYPIDGPTPCSVDDRAKARYFLADRYELRWVRSVRVAVRRHWVYFRVTGEKNPSLPTP